MTRYPITIGEIEDCLRQLAKEINDVKRIGGMRPLLLEAAAKIVGQVGFVTFDIVEPVLSAKQIARVRRPARRASLPTEPV